MSRLRLLATAALACSSACAPTAGPAPAAPVVQLEPLPPAPRAAAVAPAPAPDSGPLPVTAEDPSRGEPDALVTLVQFGDLQDPFIGRAAPVLREIERRYSRSDLRLAWKNYPLSFHTHARSAALAAMAVFRVGGAGAFWSFHDAALAGWNDHSAEKYQTWAAAAGVAVDDFRTALAEPSIETKVQTDVDLGDKMRAVSGTIFVNGAECSPRTRCTWIDGVESRHVSTVVEAELTKARAALAGGAPRAGLSIRLTRHNVANPPVAPTTELAPR
jgi:protein-disulfide isomerase